MYRETMCAHYVGLSDEEINLLIAQLTGGRPVAETESPEEYSQQEFDYPEPEDASTERRIDVYPKSVVPVIVPTFDTAVGVDRFATGALERADLEWGYSSQWNPQPIFNTRIESADKPIWRASMEHDRCIIACRWFYESSGTETRISERTGRTINSSTCSRFRACRSSSSAASTAVTSIRW